MGSKDEQLGEVRFPDQDEHGTALREGAIRESEKGEWRGLEGDYDYYLARNAAREEARDKEAQGRHEGVQERDEMFHGPLPERRSELSVYRTGLDLGDPEGLPSVYEVRGGDSKSDGDKSDCTHSGGGSGPDHCDCW